MKQTREVLRQMCTKGIDVEPVFGSICITRAGPAHGILWVGTEEAGEARTCLDVESTNADWFRDLLVRLPASCIRIQAAYLDDGVGYGVKIADMGGIDSALIR